MSAVLTFSLKLLKCLKFFSKGAMKSEKLRKLEIELADLQKMFEHDLVPKKEREKYQVEIEGIRAKIEEEKQRLQYLKESGEVEDFIAPKRNKQNQGYDPQSMPEIGVEEDHSEISYMDERSYEDDDPSTLFEDEEFEEGSEKGSQEYDEDPFSERNRWKRARMIQDPERDDW